MTHAQNVHCFLLKCFNGQFPPTNLFFSLLLTYTLIKSLIFGPRAVGNLVLLL